MSNSDIYNFRPTFLYIKQHTVTGKLYFGKTFKNPEKYKGSGRYWLNHIRKHGKEHVVNLWYCLFLDRDECQEFALTFSEKHNIVKSKEWANQQPESGIGSEHWSHDKKITFGMTRLGENNPNFGPNKNRGKGISGRKLGTKATNNQHLVMQRQHRLNGKIAPISVEIDGVVYQKLKDAVAATGISYHLIRRGVSSGKFRIIS